jgi:NAD(P)-dependent dehydrogenase (short-subunit alcohol dehydrogenase family)
MTETAGKTALIIGASRGLGCALAAGYLARGWPTWLMVTNALSPLRVMEALGMPK